MLKWIAEMTAGQGFVVLVLALFLGGLVKVLLPAYPYDMFAVTLGGGFGAMAAQRYFKNKLDARNGNGADPKGGA